MMTIRGRYFHVQRNRGAPFRAGVSRATGGSNLFSSDLFAIETLIPIAGTEGLPIDHVLRDYLDANGLGHFKRIRSRTVTPDERGLLQSALSVLNHQAMLLRELIFEQVRAESFPGKPSRLKGMWLIPHNEQLLAEWCATAPHGQFRAFEVEASGNLHCGYSRYLKPECVSAIQLQENARRYWSEVPRDPLTEPVELLLEGEVKVLREIRMPGSKQTAWTKLKTLFG